MKWKKEMQGKKSGICRSPKKISMVFTVIFFSLILSVNAMASSPSFAKTEEEWAALKDNHLDYSEIPDLIHEYNITVQNNQYKYNDFLNDYGHTRVDVSNEYIKLADDLEEDKSGDDDAASKISDLQLQIQANNLRKQADDNVEDSETYYLTYMQAEDNLSESAENKFISYYSDLTELETEKEQLEVLNNNYNQTVLRQQAGMTTETDVLSSKEAVETQQDTIKKLELETENTRQKLIVMLGWKGSDQPEFGELPEVSADEINAIDPEADKEKAIENNYTLRINKKKLENAQEEATKQDLQKTISANEKQIGISVTSAWQDLTKAELTYGQKQNEAVTENNKTALAEQKYSAGLITQHELQAQQNALTESQHAVKTSAMDVLKSYMIYKWDIKGLANAE